MMPFGTDIGTEASNDAMAALAGLDGAGAYRALSNPVGGGRPARSTPMPPRRVSTGLVFGPVL
jgi:hypothetical protein